jgi:SM-20-related protein
MDAGRCAERPFTYITAEIVGLPLRLELNRDLDVRAHAAAYARHGIVRIGNVLAPHAAEAVTRVLETQMSWQLALWEGTDPLKSSYDADRLNALGQTAVKARIDAVLERAKTGYAYLYLNYPMIESYIRGRDPGHPIHEMSEFLNGTAFLRLLRDVTGRQDILKAEASATFYRPGDFLALHDDGATDAADRVCAYTLGFTRLWRPDWGGQLLLHDQGGDIADGFAPAFNCLTLFTVPRAHSVAQVASYAAGSRFSIVGWGRCDVAPEPSVSKYSSASK